MMSLKKKKDSSHSWWFDSHNSSPRQSSWLQTTLQELDDKTKGMLKVIEEDADSFAQRAEMYYRKRPELVSMVEEFYRAHRSLAEKYDQLRAEVGSRCQAIQMGSPMVGKCLPRSSKSVLSDRSSVASSDSFESENSELLDDNQEQEESQVCEEDAEVSSKVFGAQVVGVEEEEVARFQEPNIVQIKDVVVEFEKLVAVRPLCLSVRERELCDEVDKLKEEIGESKEQTATIKPKMKHINEKNSGAIYRAEKRQSDEGKGADSEVLRLQQELNQVRDELEEQKKEIAGKDEEKREAIRQLCLSLEMLKEENTCLKTYLKDDANKKSSALSFRKFRGVFSRMFQTSMVA